MHVIDAILAVIVITGVIIASVYMIAARNSTGIRQAPNPVAVDEFVRAHLEDGSWLPYISQGDADSIRQQIIYFFNGTATPPRVAVYIYVLNTGAQVQGVYAYSDTGLQQTYKALRYFVPLSGWHGTLYFVLEVRVYW